MKYFLALVCAACFWLAPSCASDPMVKIVKAKNPRCDVLKIEQDGRYVHVILQCPGNQMKKVTMLDKS